MPIHSRLNHIAVATTLTRTPILFWLDSRSGEVMLHLEISEGRIVKLKVEYGEQDIDSHVELLVCEMLDDWSA